MKLKAAIALLTLQFLGSCNAQNDKAITTIDVNTFEEKLTTDTNAQLIDVRTPGEYSAGKIADAENIDWNGNNFEAQVQKLDKSKPVYVYCKVGGRSSQAANKLAEMGFKEIYNLDGGIMKWNAAGKGENSTEQVGITVKDYEKLTTSNKKVVINFGAEWCAPCKKMKPYITKLQKELADKVTIVRLDADENKSIVNHLKIDGLPVIIIYENGKETWRNLGYLSEEEFLKKI
jgi:thioredoxin